MDGVDGGLREAEEKMNVDWKKMYIHGVFDDYIEIKMPVESARPEWKPKGKTHFG